MYRLALLALAMCACLAADVNEDLLAAARAGDLAGVKTLVEKGAAIETKTAYGQTPLYVAAMNGHAEVVKFLLDKGASADVRDTFYKASMLDFVLQRKHYGIAKMLIMKGTGKPDDYLESVARTGDAGLVQAVLEKEKPSQGALDKTYETALEQKRTEVAALLKKAGAQEPAAAVAVDPKVLESYAGTFKSDSFPLDIKASAREGRLYMQATGQGEFALKAKSPTVFEFVAAGIVVEFDSPDSFTLRQMGRELKFKKAVVK